ncbi:MAG: TetR/AcrR family transcriptional regulator [Actinomycetota bacterium]|nr:TetR/AcrR family transcriptional regulator [Actinomycetota bacterium]
MSTPYEVTGRTEQKQRTREALVVAARRLVASGVSPTVEDTANAAGISRTTAYRYFPSQRSLLVAAHPETGARSMLPADAPPETAARLAAVIGEFTSMLLQTEAQQRTMLRLSLEADEAGRAGLPLRQGRAIGWIAEALAPLHDQLPEPEIHQLVLAIRSAVGVEALAWLTDVAGLFRDEAVALMSWSAQALLHAALNFEPPPICAGSGRT